jgi:GTP-binding protein YchF
LGHIRAVDAIIHVVRCFDDDNVVHVNGSVDPLGDIETIQTELALADLDSMEKKILRVEKQARSGDKKSREEADFYLKIRDALANGITVKGLPENDDELLWMRDLHLLTDKPVLYVANVSESDLTGMHSSVAKVQELAEKEGAQLVAICGRIEAEIAELEGSEKHEFLADLGLPESGLERLIRSAYELLGLFTYFTAGVQEVRAWTIQRGTKAPQAAGVIHSDFEKGFIRAEVIAYNDFITCKGESGAKEKGLLRLEGKDYVVQDGDVMHFRFNV